eukprot:Sdes_comp10936_c0_seq1m2581
MFVLFETPAGYALFKVLDEGKLKDVDQLYKHFASAESASHVVKLKAFSKFEDTTEALSAATACIEGKLNKPLKKFLKTSMDVKSKLAVSDPKLGALLKEKLELKCVSDATIHELMRGIRSQMSSLVTGLDDTEMKAMSLGLAHSLSRYKLKFSPDKVDTMIVQAISLLDDLDKELNTYAMRVREWYGWHFPELGKMISDNIVYAKTIKKLGFRSSATDVDLSDCLPEELEEEVKETAQVSMGTEISEEDLENIHYLAEQVISVHEYRTELYDYLKNRMNAIAPNLTCMVGELVGARLISHAGSLLNLAKHPASTVQILGAEKALFRALKTKHETPKYGLIYHASLVGQSAPKNKGKISRVLAAKTSLSVRCDALGDSPDCEIGMENRAKVEARLQQLEGGRINQISGSAKGKPSAEKYSSAKSVKSYNPSSDSTLGQNHVKTLDFESPKDKPTKNSISSPLEPSDVSSEKKVKKDKKEKKEKSKDSEKKRKREDSDAVETEKKSKKDKKDKKK